MIRCGIQSRARPFINWSEELSLSIWWQGSSEPSLIHTANLVCSWARIRMVASCADILLSRVKCKAWSRATVRAGFAQCLSSAGGWDLALVDNFIQNMWKGRGLDSKENAE